MNMNMVGILEFQDNEFMKSVVTGLSGIPTELVRVTQHAHPDRSPYRLIVDRVSFCDPFLRHLLRYWSMGGTYVLNDPFFTLVYDKLSELLVYDRLGILHPRTVLLPRINHAEDMREMVLPPDWAGIGELIGFPCVVKPLDGYAWDDVSVIADPESLVKVYEGLKDKRTLLVQESVRYSAYYRAFYVGPSEVFIARWDPRPMDRGEYSVPSSGELDGIDALIRTKTIALNHSLGLDFNAVEWCVRNDGSVVVIDSYNDVPDVRPGKLPRVCYDWLVDRFCACIKHKFSSEERNSLAPRLPGLSDPDALQS
jgi:glutathione synthase/RimK-type ligase-like ATP-grasp enzyme